MEYAADAAAAASPHAAAAAGAHARSAVRPTEDTVFADAMAASTHDSEAVSERVRASVGASITEEELRPQLGLCFSSMDDADAFVRVAGARTSPYRLKTGAKKTCRQFICRSVTRPLDGAKQPRQQEAETKQPQPKHEERSKGGLAAAVGGDEGDESEEDDEYDEDEEGEHREEGEEGAKSFNGCPCRAIVVVQQVTVKQLINGSHRRYAPTHMLPPAPAHPPTHTRVIHAHIHVASSHTHSSSHTTDC